MSPYHIALALLGVAILGVAWLPSLLEKYPLSYPILYIALGMGVYALPLGLPNPDPLHNPSIVTHVAELCVIVALMGTGLKIDRPFSVLKWRGPLLLVLVLMVLNIIGLTSAAYLAGLPLAAALLLAASLSPTDPVLAGDVQVGDPNEGREDNVRFALTGEAGLNDGLAFPFVYLALALLPAAAPLAERLQTWLWMDLLYRTVAGVALGWLSGKLLAVLIFHLPTRVSIKATAYGFVSLAVTLTTYGITEMVHGYGFLAVFIAALTLRSHERHHEYHKQMHAFTDQLERLFIVVILLMLGGAIMRGLLAPLTWRGAALGLLLILVLRPLGGLFTLARVPRMTWAERGVISFFGIRGIGSIFYLSFALAKGNFDDPRQLWAIAGFTILVSVVVHGTLATPVMNWLDRRHGRRIAAELAAEACEEATSNEPVPAEQNPEAAVRPRPA
ncbi:sodium:proton antiporter [Hymenobacter busanensis]|uniref:Sodium:proton antiporter n=1 Tax=Hymenobacter busanensis TaxID=2607656 RepID=A0A7L4ZX03_9BACT|nr:cation:proton antiporter [Hymenobacter busanensis]KAA9332114.1 sodium:proton antiporter [Hymenobacter busanensis]QHJ07547.1 sodium:proton antiporter [Hymenobacter busanensis]